MPGDAGSKFHLIGDKLGGVASVSDDVADDGRGDGGVFGHGEHKYRFDIGMHFLVHLADAALKLKVGAGPETTQDKPDPKLTAKINGEPLVFNDFHRRMILKDQADPLHTLFDGEQALFFGVMPNGNDDLLEQGDGPHHDGFVSSCDGIKASGE